MAVVSRKLIEYDVSKLDVMPNPYHTFSINRVFHLFLSNFAVSAAPLLLIVSLPAKPRQYLLLFIASYH